MILELDLPLKEIKQLLDCEIDRENTLIQQRILLEQKVEWFKGLIKTINSSIKSAKEGLDVDMENMFKGFENEEEWKEAVKDQNEYFSSLTIFIEICLSNGNWVTLIF